MQLQPFPLMAVAVNPVGRASVTTTVPLVETVPVFATVTEYAAPVWPRVKELEKTFQ